MSAVIAEQRPLLSLFRLAPQGKQEMRHRVLRSLCEYVVMELVDGQDDEAANCQKDHDHRQRNLVVRPRITIPLDGTISCTDGSLYRSYSQ